MSKPFRFFLPIEPKPTPRPRYVCRGKFAQAYSEPKYKVWMEEASSKLAALAPDQPIVGPVEVEIDVLAERPKTTKLDVPKPDVDNYAKGVLDAMTYAEWWGDDAQVVSLRITKMWTEGTPGYQVKVKPIA